MNTPTTSTPSTSLETSTLLCAPSTSTPKATPSKDSLLEQNNKSSSSSIQNEMTSPSSSSSVYGSALENLQTFSSFDESFNNNSSSCESFRIECNNNNDSTPHNDSSVEYSTKLTDSGLLKFEPSTSATTIATSELSFKLRELSLKNIQSESTDTNTSSQEEVEIKSQLANKTIFKTNNPHLSIIEIPINPIQEQLENSVVLIEKSSDYEDNNDGDDDDGDNAVDITTAAAEIAKKYRLQKHKKSPIKNANMTAAAAATIKTIQTPTTTTTPQTSTTTTTPQTSTKTTTTTTPQTSTTTTSTQTTTTDEAAEKRRKKAESLIQFSKQKLNTVIAEQSAAESKINDALTEKTTLLIKNDGNSKATTAEETAAAETSTEQTETETEREIKIYDTIKEFDENLPDTVTLLKTPFGSKVYLVGTAHFSEESQNDVSFVIRNVRPDIVMVELCPARIHILKLDEKTLLEEAKNINLAKIRSIIQSNGYINGIFFILLLQMSAQVAKDLGMAPGGEFRRALEEAHKLPGCVLHLGDRPIRITLHRALRALSLWQTIKMVWRLTSNDTLSVEEVEKCKQSDLLEKLMKDLAGEFPEFSDVFVKERDICLCHALQMAAIPVMNSNNTQRPVRVVGVIGIGHARGIAQLWGQVNPLMIPNLMSIPPASLSTRICKYTVKYGLIALTLYGAFKLMRPRLGRFF